MNGSDVDNIHILHIGGFEIDAKNAGTGRLDSRKNQIDAIVATLGERQVDYIVVCGNLTAQGDFSGVEECLVKLEGVLSGHGSRKRILLAPGPKDESGNNGRAFLEFHESFYKGETINAQKIKVPSAKGIDARLFRDITLISGLHACVTPAAEELELLCKQIGVQTAEWGKAHTFEGLRILAVDANPLLSAPQLYHFTELGTLSREIDLVLCGPGAVPIVPVQPFAKMPPIVGLPSGWANGEGKSSLFWNMICVQVPPQPREPGATRFEFIVKSYDERTGYDRPALRYAPDNHVVRDPYSESVLLFKESLFDKLKMELMRAGLIEVTMYGEVWKKIIMEGLHSGMQIDKCRLVFKPFFLKNYPTGSRPTDWKPEELPILKEIQKWQRPFRTGDTTPVALVVDTAFSAQDGNRNRVHEVKQRLKDKFNPEEDGVHNGSLKVVYLVSSYDTPRVVDRDEARILLDPIDEGTLQRFIKLAACALPIQMEVFENLTGGYVGFIKLLTDELRDDYLGTNRHKFSNKWSLEDAVEKRCRLSDDLRMETGLFFRSLFNHPQERRQIAQILIDKLGDLRAKGRGHLLNDEVNVSKEEAERLGLLWELEELSYTKTVEFDDDRFVLKERIPFLVQLVREVGVQRIFLSFAETDRVLMETLRATLKENGIGTWEWKDARDISKGLKKEIYENLVRCDFVVVLWTENSLLSDRVLYEAGIAAEPDSPRLLNWFEGAVPSATPEKLAMLRADRRFVPTVDGRGRKISEKLLEFSSSGTGADTLDEVMMKLKANLQPLPRYQKKPGGKG